MTNSSRQNWAVARTRILTRMAEQRLSVADLARASGLSDKHLRTLLNDNGANVAVPRPQTLWALCDAMRWTPDSLDRILDGGEPLEAADDTGEVTRLELIDGRLQEIEAMATTALGQMRNQQEELSKFWKILRQVQGDLRAVESALGELRQARRPGDAGPS
jgi:transcriptional regulator with XRE-family HTH domain